MGFIARKTPPLYKPPSPPWERKAHTDIDKAVEQHTYKPKSTLAYRAAGKIAGLIFIAAMVVAFLFLLEKFFL